MSATRPAELLDPSRLPSHLMVDALIRKAQAAGGFAAVLRRGEAMGGAILLQFLERGRFAGFAERMFDLDGKARLEFVGPVPGEDGHEGEEALAAYRERRGARDPDLWIIELDIAEAKRFAAETFSLY